MKLAEWMAAEGHTDESVAKGVGSDRTTINRLRRGLTRPAWPLVSRIAAFTNGKVSANDFMPAPAEVRT